VSSKDRLIELAQESDDAFIARCTEIAYALPPLLQAEAARILKEVKPKRAPAFSKLVFIPIRHRPSDFVGTDPPLRHEIHTILESNLRSGDLVALAEACSRPLNPNEEAKVRESLRAKLGKFGVGLPDLPVTPWERAIFDIQKVLPIVAAGVDSTAGILFATVLEMQPDLIQGDADKATRNELLWRLGSEARTRFALSRTCSMGKAEQNVIFIQGAAHLKGVEAWSRRNSVEL